MSTPLCVVLGDIHFTLSTLELASVSVIEAIKKAKDLNIPVLLNGDTLDNKAIIRGEISNRLIKILTEAKYDRIYINTGNHDLFHEKSHESSLNFLRPYANVIYKECTIDGLHIIPYCHSENEFLEKLNKFPKGSLVFGHQGTIGGQLGHYIKDHTAFRPELTTGYKIFLNHYHKHYILHNTISIGSPYTITFGEANDGPKGFLVVNEDGSFTREILNLRQHVIIECNSTDLIYNFESFNKNDLIWLKLKGPQSELIKIDKSELGMRLFGHTNYKLDKIVTDSEKPMISVDNLTNAQIMDQLIDALPDADDHKAKLKHLWRNL